MAGAVTVLEQEEEEGREAVSGPMPKLLGDTSRWTTPHPMTLPLRSCVIRYVSYLLKYWVFTGIRRYSHKDTQLMKLSKGERSYATRYCREHNVITPSGDRNQNRWNILNPEKAKAMLDNAIIKKVVI